MPEPESAGRIINGHLLDFDRGDQLLYRLYITGDTMLPDRLKDISRFYPDIDLGLIRTGGTTMLITVVTMTGEEGVQAVEITRPRTAIPIHYNDFSVFMSGLDDFKKAAETSSADTERRNVHVHAQGPSPGQRDVLTLKAGHDEHW